MELVWFRFGLIVLAIYSTALLVDVIIFLPITINQGLKRARALAFALAQKIRWLLRGLPCIGVLWGIAQIVQIPLGRQNSPQTVNLNPDIVGQGIQFSIFVPSWAIALAIFLGQFHAKCSGTKELGMAQLFTLIYLSSNLFFRSKSLTTPELLVALMSLDCASSAVAMTFSDRETLAARKFTYIASSIQLAVVIITVLTVLSPPQDQPQTPQCHFRVFWWGFFDDSFRLSKTFWTFFAIRIISSFRTCIRSLHFARVFNEGEKNKKRMDKRGNKNHKRGLNSIILDQWDIATSSSALMPDPSGTLICQTRINTLEEGHGENHASRSASILGPVFRINYDDTPATSFSAYLEHLPYTITSYISCRVLLKQCSPLSGGWVEWGQLAALILSILALIHWLFYTTCYRLYWCSLKPSVKGWPSVQHGSPNGLFVPSLDRPIWDYIAWLDSWKFLSYHPPLSPLDLLETRLAELRDGFGLWDINGVTRSLGHLKSMQAEFLMRELIDRLREAAREGREDFVQLLVNYGVPVNSKDSDGRTPLHWATRHGYEAAVRLLLETGKVSINSKDKYGKTALHEAVEHKRKAVVQLLLETKKGDINSKDRRGKTPLSIAAGKEDETMVQLLQSFTAKGSNH